MQSIFRVSADYDDRDLFPLHVPNPNYPVARRWVARYMRDNFGVLYDSDITDGLDLAEDDVMRMLYYGACNTYRKLRGWPRFGFTKKISDHELFNNFGIISLTMIVEDEN